MIYKWGTTRRINAYADYMKKTFGGRVQKLTIDAGFTCPNRDGSKGTGGCTFCLNDAFNHSYCDHEKPIKQQLEEGISFHEKRYRRAARYLAYFQAFSNTYNSIDHLVSVYEQARQVEGIAGIVIGTRPDCIDDEKLDYLAALSKRCHVVVEYGIESVNDETLKRVNRCHTFGEARDAIVKTSERGIHTGGHVIFGLPGESTEQMMASAKVLSSLPLNSIKLHQLQIVKGTAMERQYQDHPEEFNLFSEPDYLKFVADFIARLNPDFIIERIAGETPPRFAVVRPWGPRYDQILVRFEKLLEEKDLWQGKLF